MTCAELETSLAAYADDLVSAAQRADIDGHLRTCGACRRSVRIQRSMRQAMATYGRSTADLAPPGLRTRLAATLAAERSPLMDLGWRSRVSAFAAAALVVLAVGAVALPVVTGRSTVVLAAQLALDHLKCFTIDGHDHGEALTVAEAEAELLHDYGWDLKVPANAGAAEGRLVAVRRCLYGDGRAAHLLYRVAGEPVSLFILPGLERPAQELTMLGHDEVVWTEGGRTYLLVGARGNRNRLARMASNLRNGAQ